MTASAFIQRVSNYRRVIGWLSGDLTRQAGLGVLGVAVLSSLGVATRLSAVGVVLLFVHVQTSPAPVRAGGFEVPTDNTLGTLLLWGAAALVLAVFSAVCSYRAEVMSFRIARKYVRHAIQCILRSLASGRPGVRSAFADPEPAAAQLFVRRLLTRDATMLLRALNVMLGFLTPFLLFVLATASLVWLDAGLTGLVAIVVCLYLLPFYVLNRQVVRASHRRELHSAGLGSAVLRITANLFDRSPAPGQGERLARALLVHSPMEAGLDAYRDIVLARRKVIFLQDVFLGLALVLLLIIFGAFFVRETSPWSALLTYLMALGYASSGMSQVAVSITRLNRYLPQVRRYVRFRQRLEEITPYGDGGGGDGATPTSALRAEALSFELRVVDARLPGSLAELVLRPGDRLTAVIARPLTAWDGGSLLEALSPGKGLRLAEEGRAFVCLRIVPLPPMPLDDLFPDGEMRQAVMGNLEALGVTAEIAALDEGSATMMTTEVERTLSPRLRMGLALAEPLAMGVRMFVLGWRVLARLDAQSIDAVLALLCDCVVVVVHEFLPTSQPKETPWTAVVGDVSEKGSEPVEGIIGIGDGAWHAEIAKTGAGIVPVVSGDDRMILTAEEDDMLNDDEDEV